MEVKFPRYVDYRYFYRYLLGKIIRFGREEKERLLILNLTETEHMTPGVVCDLLCSIKYIKSMRELEIQIVFGGAYKLVSYLWNAQFFLHAEYGDLFISDADSYGFQEENKRKQRNTSKICRVLLPASIDEEKDYLPYSVVNLIQQQIFMLFMGDKANGMQRYNLYDPLELTATFSQFIENSYVHSRERTNCGCYFTFQNYQKTGLNFACSDIGIGLYESLLRKIERKGKNILKIFTEQEVLKVKEDRYKRDLVGIFESIAYRIGENPHVEFGYPFILNKLIIQRDGTLAIHSGNTLLEMDREILNRCFVTGEENRVAGYCRDYIRSIVLERESTRNLMSIGRLRIFNYEYPGVHLSAHVGGV